MMHAKREYQLELVGTGALVAAAATSTDVLIALVVKKLPAKTGAKPRKE